jgi:hypothetical protein
MLPIHREEVGCVEAGRRSAVAEEPVKIRQALGAMRDRLAVEDGGRERERPHRLGNGTELNAPIPSVPRPQAHALAVLPRDDAEAVVLYLERPARPGRRPIGEDGLSGTHEAGGRSTLARQRGTHQHRSNLLPQAPFGSPCDKGDAREGWRSPFLSRRWGDVFQSALKAALRSVKPFAAQTMGTLASVPGDHVEPSAISVCAGRDGGNGACDPFGLSPSAMIRSPVPSE